MQSAINHYRQVAHASRVLSAAPGELTGILFEELVDTLRQASRSRVSSMVEALGNLCSRALLAVTELEAGLDFDRGGDLAQTLLTIYRHVRKCVTRAMTENNPFWCQTALEAIEPIAEAWDTVRSRA